MSELNPALRKAAIVVASLDRATADKLLDQMSDEQAALVRQAMVDLPDIETSEQNQVLGEFFNRGPNAMADEPPPRVAAAAPVVRSARVTNYDRIEWEGGDEPTPFRFLHEAKAHKLTQLLAGEHPQTMALVLSHLSPEQASEVLAPLSSALQVDVIRRLVDLDDANPDVMRDVERGLKTRILEHIHDERRRAAGVKAVTSILAAANPGVKREILSNLATHDRHLAGRLVERRREFTFADIGRLDDETLMTVLTAAEPEIVILALTTAPEALVEQIIRLLPAAEGKALRKALNSPGPTRLSDVDQAQHELATVAQRLESEGRIELPNLRGASVASVRDEFVSSH
jgi:flagellar motor switch protein FliG